jgi:hypothetical protein
MYNLCSPGFKLEGCGSSLEAGKAREAGRLIGQIRPISPIRPITERRFAWRSRL